MMESLRTWLLGIVLTAFAAGLACELCPKGRDRTLVKIVSGAIMVMAFLRPLGMASWQEVTIPTWNMTFQTEEQARIYRAEQENVMAPIIAERLETYIWDKATELGLVCTVRVTVFAADGGIPLPKSVEIGAAYHSELAAWIEEVVGIPAEMQKWLEESA